MNLINRYKKTALLATVVAAISMSSVLSAGCTACAAAAAIRQSIKDAQAAKLAAGGKKALEAELDAVDSNMERAPREELVDPCITCHSHDHNNPCSLDNKLQMLFNCCVNTNEQVRHQGHEAKKCCKRLHHEIDEVEDQIEDCCSVIENLIVNQSVSAAACCSVLESLAISQIDQSAECCSVIESRIGDPATTIASLQDCGIDVLAFVNSNDDDVLTWLKRLYVLMYQVFSCTCCNF